VEAIAGGAAFLYKTEAYNLHFRFIVLAKSPIESLWPESSGTECGGHYEGYAPSPPWEAVCDKERGKDSPQQARKVEQR